MELFIARQPIFTQQQQVYAYELLFRSGTANAFPEVDANHASARVMVDSLCTLGLETLTGGKRAFINMTRDLLVGDYATLLPKDAAVIEVLESVAPDEKVVAACQRLKEAGYTIALDDFTEKAAMAPLTALADIIKVDFLTTRPGERRALVKRYGPRGVRLLAEKVETPAAFQEAVTFGYHYFQGYFFAKPAVLQTKAAPEFRLTYLSLLQEVVKRDVDLRKVASIVGRDVTLSYKLLRYINSAYFGLRRTISSIPEALGLLGGEGVEAVGRVAQPGLAGIEQAGRTGGRGGSAGPLLRGARRRHRPGPEQRRVVPAGDVLLTRRDPGSSVGGAAPGVADPAGGQGRPLGRDGPAAGRL